MKLQLIQPPDDATVGREWTCPVGLELIASDLKGFIDVEIIDGSFMRVEDIINQLDGDYIGVQDWYTKHTNSLKILKAAKQKGATTIVGGPNATHLADRMLANHDFIDFAVIGDGEEAVYKLIMGGPPELIHNLAYKKDGKVIVNRNVNVDINERTFDLEHIQDLDLSKYYAGEAFPISSVRGCIKADLGERCTFCSIEHTLKVMKPENVWKQIDLLHRKYGIEYFHETGDSFLIGRWPEKLLNARPEHLSHISFSIYAGVEEVTPEAIEACRKLNVRVIFIGIESTDWNILSSIKKPYTVERIEEVLQLIYDAGIHADIPFMYGLPGETAETMKRNNEYIEHITKTRHDLSKVMVNLTVPIYGCDLFDDLAELPIVQKAYRSVGNINRDDAFDYELLIRLMIAHQTDVDYPSVVKAIKEAQQIIGAKNSDIRRYKMASQL
jgi:anaerobic magnesium-protoporphyrin IX monomethyl ester cyclase